MEQAILARHEMNATPESLSAAIQGSGDSARLFACLGLAPLDFVRLALTDYVSLIASSARAQLAEIDPLKNLSKPAFEGKTVFEGKARCSTCHPSPYFTDGKFHRIGLPLRKIVFQTSANPGAAGRMQLGYDYGYGNVRPGPSTMFAFRTPSILGVALTAPFMHDGTFRNLREVVDFYDRGGDSNGELVELRLTPQEKALLIEFLSALTFPPQ